MDVKRWVLNAPKVLNFEEERSQTLQVGIKFDLSKFVTCITFGL